MKNIFTSLFICIFCGVACTVTPEKKQRSGKLFSKEKEIDTTNKAVYDFVNAIIQVQDLDTNYGIAPQPLLSLEPGGDDAAFLQKLLKVSGKKKRGDSTGKYFIFGESDNTLSQKDIDSMLLQKKQFRNFTWDSSRLALKSKTGCDYYGFSVPLFSADGQMAIVSYETVAGSVYIFEKIMVIGN